MIPLPVHTPVNTYSYADTAHQNGEPVFFIGSKAHFPTCEPVGRSRTGAAAFQTGEAAAVLSRYAGGRFKGGPPGRGRGPDTVRRRAGPRGDGVCPHMSNTVHLRQPGTWGRLSSCQPRARALSDGRLEAAHDVSAIGAQ